MAVSARAPLDISNKFPPSLSNDKFVIPEENKHFYSEKIIYMNNCYQCNDDSKIISSFFADIKNSKTLDNDNNNIISNKNFFCLILKIMLILLSFC